MPRKRKPAKRFVPRFVRAMAEKKIAVYDMQITETRESINRVREQKRDIEKKLVELVDQIDAYKKSLGGVPESVTRKLEELDKEHLLVHDTIGTKRAFIEYYQRKKRFWQRFI